MGEVILHHWADIMQVKKSCGLYYKHITIVDYEFSVINKFGA